MKFTVQFYLYIFYILYDLFAFGIVFQILEDPTIHWIVTSSNLKLITTIYQPIPVH